MSDDKRIHQRFSVERDVSIRLSSGNVIRGLTRDLSFGGSFIECDTSMLQLEEECYLAIGLENDLDIIEIFSDIRYSTEDGVGCRFLTFNFRYYQFLTHYALHPFSS